MKCAECGEYNCYYRGKNCTKKPRQMLFDLYRDPEELQIMKANSTIVAKYYASITRLEEIVLFSKKMGYSSIGLAFCIGLKEEARLVNVILKEHFEVTSVCCKVCGMERKDLGLEKVNPDNYESMCNPKVQAEILNQANTQLNILVGLCVGHDILLMKACQSPGTVLIVKDRVLSHNPAGAVNSSYYARWIPARLRQYVEEILNSQ